MTEQTQPTDAELMPCPFCGTQPDECDIGHFVVECPSCAIVGPTSDNSDAARRAWNTRWGTPAGAEEVVAWLSTDSIGERYLCFTKPKDTDPARPLVFGDTTPQPTQAQAGFKSGAKSFQTYAEANAYSKGYYAGKKAATKAQAGAVPLTDEQCDAIYEALDAFGREVDHYEYGLPYCTSDGETLAKPEAREVIRQAAHGIKGADHA